MFTDLATIRADVKARLQPLLPASWKVEESLEGAVKSLTPVLYIEFVRIDSTVQGEPLARGQVCCAFNIIITDPKSDERKAEDAVDAHVIPVLGALDTFDDIFWSDAEKKRLTDGPLAWAINALALANTNTEGG